MISMYQVSIPPCLRALTALSAVLAKAEADCTARAIDPAVLLQARLYPDMFPLVRQVQIASDTARRLAARLTGVAADSVPDTETSFGELQQRLAMTMEALHAVQPAALDGTEAREITLPLATELRLSGLAYVQGFALPNLYFHTTTAYAILRHNGVVLGKQDFLGPLA